MSLVECGCILWTTVHPSQHECRYLTSWTCNPFTTPPLPKHYPLHSCNKQEILQTFTNMAYLALRNLMASAIVSHIVNRTTVNLMINCCLVAGQTILPSILDGMASIADAKNPRKFVYQAISYKPFISLFNLTQAAEMNPQLAGIGKSQSFITLHWHLILGNITSELRCSRCIRGSTTQLRRWTGCPTQLQEWDRGRLQNIQFPWFRRWCSSVQARWHSQGMNNWLRGIDTHVDNEGQPSSQPVAFSDLPTWCKVCNNQKDRGCAALAAASSPATLAVSKHAIGPVAAGFVGAGLGIAVMLAMLSVLVFLGVLTFGRRKSRAKVSGYDVSCYPLDRTAIWQSPTVGLYW